MRQGFLLRMPQTLKDNLFNESDRIGISLNALILQILWNYMEKVEAKLENKKPPSKAVLQEQMDLGLAE